MNKIDICEKPYLKKNIQKFDIGDVVRVYLKVVEAGTIRIQAFEGKVIARKGAGLKQTFIVRRVSYGVGIEKTFQLHSPNIERIEIVKKDKTKRAKLYYLRKK